MPIPETEDIRRFTDAIIALVDGAIAEGALPATVRSFEDLHRYMDANDFLQDAQVPYDGGDESLDLTAAVQAAVNLRLGAPTRPYCTFGRCTYPGHDHTTSESPDGDVLDQPEAWRCPDCGHPGHWDARLRQLRHDDPALDASGCQSMTVGNRQAQVPPTTPPPDPNPAPPLWADAWVAAATDPRCFDFGPYPAQITDMPDRSGATVTARFSLEAMRRIAEDQVWAPGQISMGWRLELAGDTVLARSSGKREIPAGADGWWHLDDAPWSWVLSDLEPNHPLWPQLFAGVRATDDCGCGPRRCTVCGTVDDTDTVLVPSRVGTGYQDTINRCRRCGSAEVVYAERITRTERAPWPAPAPGPTGADGIPWDAREALPAGWWRLPHDIGLRILAPLRMVDGLILSCDLHDSFGTPGPAYVDLRPLTAWDTGHDAHSPGRVAFDALCDRLPGRFTTVVDINQPGTVFLTVPLLELTDEVTDAILDQYRVALSPRPDRPAVPAHDCQAAGTLVYVADYGAPGTGQAWTCTECARAWSRVGGAFWPAESGAHILSLRDIE